MTRPTDAIRYVVIHHSASNDSTTGLEQLQAERRHRNEGYNVVIDDDDALRNPAAGRDGRADWTQDAADTEVSNGTYGINAKAWNVCIDGNFEVAKPTEDEIATLVQVVAAKVKRWGWRKADVVRIISHKEAGLKLSSTRYGTACPGRNLIARIPEIRRRVAAYLPE